jgi:hypothetical protein
MAEHKEEIKRKEDEIERLKREMKTPNVDLKVCS